MKRKPNNIEILLDSACGIYIPQIFAEYIKDGVYPETSEIDQADLDILLSGPENELYLDAWCTVLDNVRIFDVKGREYFLYQDEDLFAVAVDTPESELSELMGD